jgi:hypothetical protein
MTSDCSQGVPSRCINLSSGQSLKVNNPLSSNVKAGHTIETFHRLVRCGTSEHFAVLTIEKIKKLLIIPC